MTTRARAIDAARHSCHARSTLAVRWQMKDPVSRRLVLPLTRLEQVAHHRDGAGTTHALRGLRALRETADLMATGHEDLDQLEADESGGSRDKRGRPCVGCHVASVECRGPGDHPQRSHRTRTTPVRTQR